MAYRFSRKRTFAFLEALLCIVIAAVSFAAYDMRETEVAVVAPVTPTITRVAAIGDSITYGTSAPENMSYPVQLKALLGKYYTVTNYGVGGRTLLDGDHAYTKEDFYQKSLQARPGIVIIMLGSNDARSNIWDAAKYERQLAKFVDSYKALSTPPIIFLMTPPAVFSNEFGIQPDLVENEVAPIVRRVARQTDSRLIDIFSITNGRSNIIPDGVHPNSIGYELIAKTVYEAIKKASTSQ